MRRWKLPYAEHPWVELSENQLLSPIKRTVVTGIAMVDSGEVYASFFRKVRDGSERGSAGLFRLKKKDGEQACWVPVTGTLGRGGDQNGFDELEGTDGKNLVYSRFGEHYWFFSAAPR